MWQLIKSIKRCFGFGDDVIGGVRLQQVFDYGRIGGPNSFGVGIKFLLHRQSCHKGGPRWISDVFRKNPHRCSLLRPIYIARLAERIQEVHHSDRVMRVENMVSHFRFASFRIWRDFSRYPDVVSCRRVNHIIRRVIQCMR